MHYYKLLKDYLQTPTRHVSVDLEWQHGGRFIEFDERFFSSSQA